MTRATVTITTTVERCTDRNDDWDCKAGDESVRRISSTTAVWRFDGESFVPVKR